MNHQLLLFIAFFLLPISWFTNFRHYLRRWIVHRRSQPSIAKRKRKNKSRPFPLPVKRPDYPICQTEKAQDFGLHSNELG